MKHNPISTNLIIARLCALFLLLCFAPALFAQNAESIKREILELEIEMLMIENDPSKRDTLELMRKKHQILRTKLDSAKPQAQNLAQNPAPTPRNRATQATTPKAVKAAEAVASPESKQAQGPKDPQDPAHRRKNRSGMLLGLSIGGMETESTYSTFGGLLPFTLRANAAPVGVRIGWQSFGDGISEKMRQNPIGVRFYIDSHVFVAKTKDGSAHALQGFGAYNADLLAEFNIPKSYVYLGVFGGIGYGVLFYEAQGSLYEMSIEASGLFYNLGAALTLGAKHRLEFYYKFLPTNSYKNPSKGIEWKSSDFMGFAYQYTF